MVKVGRDFWNSSSWTLLLKQSHLELVAQDDVCEDGDSTTSLGNLCQCSVTLTVKLFPDVQREPPAFQFVPIASCPATGHHWKEPGSLFFVALLQIFVTIDETPLSLLSSRLNSPSSLSLYPRERCSQNSVRNIFYIPAPVRSGNGRQDAVCIKNYCWSYSGVYATSVCLSSLSNNLKSCLCHHWSHKIDSSHPKVTVWNRWDEPSSKIAYSNKGSSVVMYTEVD